MKVKKYTKKPVTIEAIKWDGTNALDIIKFCNRGRKCGRSADGELEIYTLEGVMIAEIGDYIIKGIKGEFYPCKQDIFEKTYEEFQDEKSILKKFEEFGYEVKVFPWRLVMVKGKYKIIVNKINKTCLKINYNEFPESFSFEEISFLNKLFNIWGLKGEKDEKES